MASVAASAASAGYPVAVDVDASPSRVASTSDAAITGDATSRRAAYVALPARSATIVRIAGLAGLCATTLLAPTLLFVWMPIVLGVPHIASDIRFLLLPLPRRQIVVSVAACALLVALKAASLVLGPIVLGLSLLRIEVIVVAMWLLVMLALERRPRRSHALARHAPMPRRRYAGAAWIVAAFVAMLVISLPVQFAFVAAFAHNIVAVIAWLVVKRPPRVHALALVATIVAGVCVIFAAGAPFLVAFTFMQGVHYTIWLDWIPRGAPRMPTKPWMLVVVGLLAVIAAALVDPMWARTTYLALATFHIYLELVVLGARLARRYA